MFNQEEIQVQLRKNIGLTSKIYRFNQEVEIQPRNINLTKKKIGLTKRYKFSQEEIQV